MQSPFRRWHACWADGAGCLFGTFFRMHMCNKSRRYGPKLVYYTFWSFESSNNPERYQMKASRISYISLTYNVVGIESKPPWHSRSKHSLSNRACKISEHAAPRSGCKVPGMTWDTNSHAQVQWARTAHAQSSFLQSVLCYVPSRESGHTSHEAHRSKGLAVHKVQTTWVSGVFMAVSWSGWHCAQGGLAHNHLQRGDGCQPPAWDRLWGAVDCTSQISLFYLLLSPPPTWHEWWIWVKKWIYHVFRSEKCEELGKKAWGDMLCK